MSRLVACALRMPETSTKISAFWVASTRFSARARLEPGQFAQGLGDLKDVAPWGRQTGADGGAAEIDHPQPFMALGDAPAVAVDRLGIGAKGPAGGDQHRVLQLGPGHLDHMGPALLLLLKGLLQGDHVLLQAVKQQQGRPPERGGKDIVGRLVEIEVVERD